MLRRISKSIALRKTLSQFGKIIRIDTKTIRAADRATMGVKLLDLDDADKVAVVTIPNEEKNEEENRWCSRDRCWDQRQI